MRDIQAMVTSNSSSSSQQPVNNVASSSGSKPQQGQGDQSTLIGDISTLRSRLQELDSNDSPMNSSGPRSQSGPDNGGRREPPSQSSESLLVNQLRKELTSVEEQKAEMELTLMNQMSNLAYENQTTIDGLHARLAEHDASTAASQSSPLPEVQRLKKSLGEERGMRLALEEERDARHQETEQLKEDRDCCEQECTTLKEGLVKMQLHMDVLHSSNVELSNEVRTLQGEKDEAVTKAVETKLADVERSHQGQMSEIKASYQQRYSQLEKQLLSQTPDRNQAGVGHLHRKIAELESENETLSHQVIDLSELQSMNQALEESLEEQTNNSAKLWESLEESQQRCNMLEKELSQQFENSNNNQGDLHGENEMLSSQIAAIHEQCVGEQDKCAKLKESLKSERSTNSELRLSLRQHQQRYEELNRNLHRNQSGMGLVNGKVVSLEKEKKTLQGQLAKEQSKTEELEASLAKGQNAIEEQLQSTAGRRQSDVAALEGAQLELQSVMNSYQSDMARLERKVKLSEQQLTERNRQNQRLEVEINEERRIRKSLTAQLTQLKMANKSNGGEDNVGVKSHNNVDTSSMDAELQRLHRENTKLNDELKLRARKSGEVDPAEIEFLRKQNRVLGERATGLHGEQMKELESLREKTTLLTAELSELHMNGASAVSTTSHSSNPGAFHQKAELDQLKKQNATLSDEVHTLKHQMASSGGAETLQSPNRRNNFQPASPRRPFGSRPASPTIRAPPSPRSTSRSEQAPPVSPPLMRKKPSNPGSPRTPVRGIVDSFERRISRTNSCSSLASVAEAAAQLQAEPHPTSTANNSGSTSAAVAFAQGNALTNQARDALSSELEDIRRELNEEKASVQELHEKYNKECDLVQNLRTELSKMEQSESKRSQLERSLQDREQEVLRMRAKINELEDIALEVGGMHDNMDKEKVAVQDLQRKLDAESELVSTLQDNMVQMEKETTAVKDLQEKLEAESWLVSTLRTELAKAEENEERRLTLEEQSKDSELETQRLRSKVANLEMLLSNAQSLASDEEELERVKVELLQADAARKGFEKKLFEDRAEMERLQTERLSAESRLEQSDVQLQKLKEEIALSRASSQKLEHRKEEDEDIIERLQTELGAARMGLEQSLDQLEILKSKSNHNEPNLLDKAAIEQDKAEIEKLRSELIVAKQALDINVEEMENLQKCVKDADASRMIAVRQSMSSQNEGQEEMNRLMSELAANKRGESEEVKRLRSQVAALQQELGDALTHVEELESIISNIQTAHGSELQDAQNNGKRSSRSIGKEVNTLKVELTKNQISRADMQMEYMGKIHDLEKKIDVMQVETDDELQHKIKEMNQMQMTLTSKEDEIRQLTKEREQICSSMNNFSSSRKDEMDELQEELLNLTAKTAAQARETQSLKMQIEEHDFRKSEVDKLKERIEELEEDVRRVPTRRSEVSQSDVEIMKAENKMLRESIRDLGMERRSLQEKLEAVLAEKSGSKSTQVLRERNTTLKKEVEKLTKRLKKMEHSMTRFTI